MSIIVCFREAETEKEERREQEVGYVREFEGGIRQCVFVLALSSTVCPSCQLTHNITFSTEDRGANPIIMLSSPIIPQLLGLPGQSIQTLSLIPYYVSLILELKGSSCNRLSSIAACSSTCMCVYMCVSSNHSTAKAVVYSLFLYFDIR